MARSVLIVERVEEQQARFRDRRGIWHQRDFAEPTRALVSVEHLVKTSSPFVALASTMLPASKRT